MRTIFRITRSLLEGARKDLRRRHAFAYERVGFITCRFGHGGRGDLICLAREYFPVADEDYIEDRMFGALIGSDAFRKALQVAYTQNVGLFHVHVHGHTGVPAPSGVDVRETAKFVPDFFHVRPNLPHGAMILSSDSLSARIWVSSAARPKPVDQFSIIGAPLLKVDGLK
jgi:hypothetical protein